MCQLQTPCPGGLEQRQEEVRGQDGARGVRAAPPFWEGVAYCQSLCASPINLLLHLCSRLPRLSLHTCPGSSRRRRVPALPPIPSQRDGEQPGPPALAALGAPHPTAGSQAEPWPVGGLRGLCILGTRVLAAPRRAGCSRRCSKVPGPTVECPIPLVQTHSSQNLPLNPLCGSPAPPPSSSKSKEENPLKPHRPRHRGSPGVSVGWGHPSQGPDALGQVKAQHFWPWREATAKGAAPSPFPPPPARFNTKNNYNKIQSRHPGL